MELRIEQIPSREKCEDVGDSVLTLRLLGLTSSGSRCTRRRNGGNVVIIYKFLDGDTLMGEVEKRYIGIKNVTHVVQPNCLRDRSFHSTNDELMSQNEMRKGHESSHLGCGCQTSLLDDTFLC